MPALSVAIQLAKIMRRFHASVKPEALFWEVLQCTTVYAVMRMRQHATTDQLWEVCKHICGPGRLHCNSTICSIASLPFVN